MAHAALEEPQEFVSALHLAATVEEPHTLDTAPMTPQISGAVLRPRAEVVETAGGPANVPEALSQTFAPALPTSSVAKLPVTRPLSQLQIANPMLWHTVKPSSTSFLVPYVRCIAMRINLATMGLDWPLTSWLATETLWARELQSG